MKPNQTKTLELQGLERWLKAVIENPGWFSAPTSGGSESLQLQFQRDPTSLASEDICTHVSTHKLNNFILKKNPSHKHCFLTLVQTLFKAHTRTATISEEERDQEMGNRGQWEINIFNENVMTKSTFS